MIDISKLCRCHSVRILEESDVDMILEICKQNAIFYKYTEAHPTKGNILEDIIDKGNPQSTHFWKKNGFEVISEADVNGWTKLVAERQFTRGEDKESERRW